MASSTVENYLKAILQLESGEGRKATVGSIAEELKVTPGTVSVMLKQLSEQELVHYIPRREVSLLEDGRRQALDVVRRHRLIESFLVQVMGFDWSEVHEEAEVLEHVISNRFLDKMDAMLGHPTHDPHGDPIPTEDGALPVVGRSLSMSEAGSYTLVRVDDSDPNFLNWLTSQNLEPGVEFVLDDSQKIVGLLTLKLKGGAKISLSLEASQRLFVD